MKDFIETYRVDPCLWKAKSKDYSNRMMRNVAKQELVKACLPYHPGATVEWVKSKIQNLRTVYKKELNKVEASKKSGAPAEDVYVPKLWYFDLLQLVKDQETPLTSTSSMPTDSSSSTEVEQAYDIPASGTPALLSEGLLLDAAGQEDTTSNSTVCESQLTADSQDVTEAGTLAKNIQKRMRRRIREIQESDALTEKMLDCANTLMTKRKEQDTFDFLGATIASKMRSSSKRIQDEMERLLCDLMCRATAEDLWPDTVISPSNRRHKQSYISHTAQLQHGAMGGQSVMSQQCMTSTPIASGRMPHYAGATSGMDTSKILHYQQL
ncbi:uncharacterized protein LOC142104773 [Mixophyes fleayi]|uniref:uncharacterized protein LOC142104773 n=1 Tax=Mixophyes fleayi TaxID=3061075 RepID=UPI003F4E2E2D